MKPIRKYQAVQYINQTKGRFFSGTYIKKDGTVRVFNGRLNVKKGVTGKGLAFNPADKGLIPYYDTKRKGFRMLNVATLQQLNVNGKKYEVL